MAKNVFVQDNWGYLELVLSPAIFNLVIGRNERSDLNMGDNHLFYCF